MFLPTTTGKKRDANTSKCLQRFGSVKKKVKRLLAAGPFPF